MNQQNLLYQMAHLDLWAGRTGNAAAHLREALQLESRVGTLSFFTLDYCGHLCAATGHYAEAVTAWAAYAKLGRDAGSRIGPGTRATGKNHCARPGRHSGPIGPEQRKNAARR